MTTHTADRILHALFCLSRDTLPIDATALGRATGHSATQAADALVLLEQHGWVDATRARLTLLGLARAARMEASSGGGGLMTQPAMTAQPQARRAPLAAAPVYADAPRVRRAESEVEVEAPRARKRTSSRELVTHH